jgi:dCTP deaminase
MFANGKTLLKYAPIKDMETEKKRLHGVSYGLSEAGYDIRIKQTIIFDPNGYSGPRITLIEPDGSLSAINGRFTLASAMEEFTMPQHIVGMVKDKSTWARKGVSVFNTVAEPGWNGFLTMELVFHGNERVEIKAGSGIAQVLFAMLVHDGDYADGKYQNAQDKPQAAISS